eukprot:4436753-Amphidinium_carterae.1
MSETQPSTPSLLPLICQRHMKNMCGFRPCRSVCIEVGEYCRPDGLVEGHSYAVLHSMGSLWFTVLMSISTLLPALACIDKAISTLFAVLLFAKVLDSLCRASLDVTAGVLYRPQTTALEST